MDRRKDNHGSTQGRMLQEQIRGEKFAKKEGVLH